MKNNIIKVVKRIAIFAIVVIVINFIFYVQELSLQGQYLRSLDYDITLNEDGSMDIIETWDIYISKTNTLFRDFNLSSKFGEITNVKVKDLETGEDLTEIYKEMYHVTDNCYYGLEISGNKFEIAWGTGMEAKRGNKKYQISYTVTDVVSDYKDCQELYWMILDDDNGIPAKNVTGTITLPESVSNISNLKVWGHGSLNGEISIESENCVKFEVDGLKAETMLEVRVVTSDKIFNITENDKINNYSYLATIESEETKWAEETNSITTEFYKKVAIIFVIIYCAILTFQLIRIIQYYKLYKKNKNEFRKSDLKYYRDIPRENESTPGEASYLYYFNKSLGMIKQSDAIAGTILDLALKKEVSLRCDNNTVYVKIIGDGKNLKSDEKAIYKLLKKVEIDEKEFDINDLNSYAKINYTDYSNTINKLVNSSRESLYSEGLVDKEEAKFYKNSKDADNSYWILSRISQFVIVFYVIAAIIPLFRHMYELSVSINFLKSFLEFMLICAPIVILILIKNKLLSKIQNKIAVLTQKGYDEQIQWKALARYMEDFSMLDEKEVPSLVVWEKYLVYATTFGIAEKVIKQMKAKYPEVFVEEYWKDEEIQNYPVLNFALYNETHFITSLSPMSSIRDNVESARRISASEISKHSSSSGSGGGGGFSGGGGGRWWRRPEWAEDNRRSKKYEKLVFKERTKQNMEEKKRIVTGDRPTGRLHIGHYFGSLANRVKLQDEYETYILVADVQALTDNFNNPEKVRKNVREVVIDYLSCGIDPEKSTIYIQSMIPETAELTVFYSNLVTIARLERNPTVKTELAQKKDIFGESVTYGFLGYPVSQAADITVLNGSLVPAGEDQEPLIEQCREIVRKFNSIYGEVLTEPEILLSNAKRIKGLDGNEKMGKSLGNAIYLSDSEEEITRKVMSAVTDPGRIKKDDLGNPDICMVSYYHKLFTPSEDYETVCKECRAGERGCVACKKQLANNIIEFLRPIREKRAYYEAHPEIVDKIILEGTAKAKKEAEKTMKRVKKAMKLDYFCN